MRITFTRSGGFAGVRLRAVVNEEELSAETAAQLRQLVDEADCFRLPGEISADRKQPDRFQYELLLEDGEHHNSILVDEEAAPPALQPLLEWLTDVAR
ncbi:MAG: protealysin inhibitor emfourin [Verrucomicrobiia bacterium]